MLVVGRIRIGGLIRVARAARDLGHDPPPTRLRLRFRPGDPFQVKRGEIDPAQCGQVFRCDFSQGHGGILVDPRDFHDPIAGYPEAFELATFRLLPLAPPLSAHRTQGAGAHVLSPELNARDKAYLRLQGSQGSGCRLEQPYVIGAASKRPDKSDRTLRPGARQSVIGPKHRFRKQQPPNRASWGLKDRKKRLNREQESVDSLGRSRYNRRLDCRRRSGAGQTGNVGP